MKKRVKGSIVLALICALVLSGCGGGNKPAANASTEATSVEVVVVEPDELINQTAEPEPEEPEHTYADVLPDSPLFEAIESAADKGLLEGFTADDNFRPDDHLDNANMALLFYNMAGRPELTEEAEALQIANLEEANEEQAIAIRWYSQAFAGYGFTTEGDEINFLPPDSFTRNVDFSNTVFLATEQFEGDSPLTDEYAEYRGPEEEEVTEITRAEAVEVLNQLTDTFPVGTEFAQELSEEVLAQINPPAEQPVEVAVTPTPAPTSTPVPQQQEAQQQAPAPASTPEPAPTPTPAPAPQPEVAPATPAGDMTNPQWVCEQVIDHANACGFGCPGGIGANGMMLVAYDFEHRKWGAIDVSHMGNGIWFVGGWTNFFDDYASAHVSSIDEIKAFISNHAH